MYLHRYLMRSSHATSLEIDKARVEIVLLWKVVDRESVAESKFTSFSLFFFFFYRVVFTPSATDMAKP